MAFNEQTESDIDAIRRIIDQRAEAVGRKSVDDATAHLAPAVRIFDVITPLEYVGADAVRQRTAQWYASFDGPIGYEVRDVTVEAGADVAFCHFIYHVSGSTTNGGTVDMWVRATACLRKGGGGWRIVHEHNSAPFDPATGKAALDITPS